MGHTKISPSFKLQKKERVLTPVSDSLRFFGISVMLYKCKIKTNLYGMLNECVIQMPQNLCQNLYDKEGNWKKIDFQISA